MKDEGSFAATKPSQRAENNIQFLGNTFNILGILRI